MRITTLVLIGCAALSFVFLPHFRTLAQTVVDNADASISAIVASLPSVDTGGGTVGSYSGVRFSGFAYPGATVTLLRGKNEGTFTTVADQSGKFTFLFTDIQNPGQLFFSMFATDVLSRRSTLLNFPVFVYQAQLTDIAGIRFAPTIDADKITIKQGDFITVDGASLPGMTVAIDFEGVEERTFTAIANEHGTYRFTAPLVLAEGEYIIRAHYENDSRNSVALRLVVGDASIPRVQITENIPGDCNVDQRVTLADFSILAFWFGKKHPPACVDTNGDGTINLIDFSILAFYWNG